ncbi:MAG: DEAD/DEAH box helicase [Pseudomonadota bacterium]
MKEQTLTDIDFKALGLAEPVLRALAERGHTVPTPIQAKAIPPLLDSADMLGIAQTGTGKTGAFVLPLLDTLSRAKRQPASAGPRALILAPTRELAIQIGEEIGAYAKHLRLRHTVIFGGVGYGPQKRALAQGVDIVVATPGRLIDHMDQGTLRLGALTHLVLDEADRMLDMGFIRDVRKIAAVLPAERQSLLFSATMPDSVARLAGDLLRDPVRVEVAPQSTPIERITQDVHHMPAGEKLDFLTDLVRDRTFSRVIVFTRTKHRANRVAEKLAKSGITAEAIHGSKSQGARQRALGGFKAGGIRVLVATDIAARGIDVDEVSHVINFELPNEPESYVHRIGRTARAGSEGAALSLCAPDEVDYLRDIERLTKQRIEAHGDVPAEARPGPRQGQKPAQGQKKRSRAQPGAGRGKGQGQGQGQAKPQGREQRPAQAEGTRGKLQGEKPQGDAGGKDAKPRRSRRRRSGHAKRAA